MPEEKGGGKGRAGIFLRLVSAKQILLRTLRGQERNIVRTRIKECVCVRTLALLGQKSFFSKGYL